ncbi:MAG: oligoribonuclease [Hymenobacter sp.]
MTDKLVWIDCEMTGLDLRQDKIIEIAALVTDSELNVLGEGVDIVIQAADSDLDGMIDVVAAMHRESGLTEEVRRSTVTLVEAEEQVLSYIRSHVPDRRAAPCAAIRSPPTGVSSPATWRIWTISCTTAWSTSPRSRS